MALGLDVPGDGQSAAPISSKPSKQQEAGDGDVDMQQQQQQQGEDGEGPMEEDGGEGGASGAILASLQQQQQQQQQDGGDGDQQHQTEGAEDDNANAAVAAVLRGAVAAVVVRSAVAALPRDLALRRGLLETLQRYSYPGVAAIAESVYQGIEADFPLVRLLLYCVWMWGLSRAHAWCVCMVAWLHGCMSPPQTT